jgi:hypothetical protein
VPTCCWDQDCVGIRYIAACIAYACIPQSCIPSCLFFSRFFWSCSSVHNLVTLQCKLEQPLILSHYIPPRTRKIRFVYHLAIRLSTARFGATIPRELFSAPVPYLETRFLYIAHNQVHVRRNISTKPFAQFTESELRECRVRDEFGTVGILG